jgi:hypothetical protein
VDAEDTQLVLQALFDIRRILSDIREALIDGERGDETEDS